MRAIPRERIAAIGEAFAVPLPDGRFGAVQVVGPGHPGEDRVALATLDGIWTAVPSPPSSYGGWFGREAFIEERRKKTSVAATSREERTFDLGVGPFQLQGNRQYATVGGKDGLPVPARTVKWRTLDSLPLTTISYTGDDPSFADYVASRPSIREVRWSCERLSGTIDLGASLADQLTITTAAADFDLTLPRFLTRFALEGATAKTRVRASRVSFPLEVMLFGKEVPPPIEGLADIEELWLGRVRHAALARLSAYRALRMLTVIGAPGKVSGLPTLARHASLRVLHLRELYDLDPAAFPAADAMPLLERVEIHGLRKDAAPALKPKLAGIASVAITGVRSDTWIAENAENPFRSWCDEHPRLGKGACAAWKKAFAEATTAKSRTSIAVAERILRGLVDELNRLDEKYKHPIDTLRREQALEAFLLLAARFEKVPTKTADAWFLAWRKF